MTRETHPKSVCFSLLPLLPLLSTPLSPLTCSYSSLLTGLLACIWPLPAHSVHTAKVIALKLKSDHTPLLSYTLKWFRVTPALRPHPFLSLLLEHFLLPHHICVFLEQTEFFSTPWSLHWPFHWPGMCFPVFARLASPHHSESP